MAKINKYKARNKERDAKRNKKPWLKRFGWAIVNPDNIQNTLLAIFTGALIFVGLLQKWTLDSTDETLKIEQRPWIAPRGAEITSHIALGETLEFAVILENTGKQPALNLIHKQEIGPLAVPLDGNGVAYWNRMPLPINRNCPEAVEQSKLGGAVAFAGQKYSSYAYIFTNGAPREFFDRKITFFAQGCIAYRAMGKTQIVPYCVFLYPAKNVEPVDWKFRFCPPRIDDPSPDQNH